MDTRVESRICSFCGEYGSSRNRLAGGLGAMICFECLDYYHDVAHSPKKVKATTRRPWEEMTDTELLSQLPVILQSAEQNAAFANDWISLIRARRISWAQIGKVLGVSRQAAWERFASHQKDAGSAEASS